MVSTSLCVSKNIRDDCSMVLSVGFIERGSFTTVQDNMEDIPLGAFSLYCPNSERDVGTFGNFAAPGCED